MLGCLAVMASGMWLATTAQNPQMLGLWRFITGLGIGGMLAAINAVTAELSSAKGRSLAMSLMVIGYPLGATIGGTNAYEASGVKDASMMMQMRCGSFQEASSLS